MRRLSFGMSMGDLVIARLPPLGCHRLITQTPHIFDDGYEKGISALTCNCVGFLKPHQFGEHAL